MNILFIGGGRRVDLARFFTKIGYHIFAYELDLQVPISNVAKLCIKGLPWNHSELEDHLRNVVKLNNIDIAIPLDCKGVAALSTIDIGIPRVVPSPVTASLCLDKKKFAKRCCELVRTYYPVPIENQPAVIKPICGFGSKDITFVDNYKWHAVGYIAQRRLTGKEFSVDAYFNRDGELVGASPRERLRVAGGEVIESITVDRPDLIIATDTIGQALNLIGPACIQFIDDENGKPWVIEANARFGGGAPLSIVAGFPMHQLVISEYCHRIKPAKMSCHAKPGLFMTRSFEGHYFDKNSI